MGVQPTMLATNQIIYKWQIADVANSPFTVHYLPFTIHMGISRRNFLQLSFDDTAMRPTFSRDLHLLHRISWGVLPEQVERIREIGYEAYIEEQLNPESIDDSSAEKQLAPYRLLNLSRREMLNQIEALEWRLQQAQIGSVLARATYSKRQLLERMVDFWTDHFNVSMGDNIPELIVYQRDVIRKHALGNFGRMLIATAKSPAMLVYLDNYVNFAEHPNENYARELLELHTLGVDGGYTEDDVREVSRAFTGWTTHNRTQTGFYFDPYAHDEGSKQILGHSFPSGRGIEDGLHVLTILARHPATAQFISRKLCMKFVSDTPPQSLVDSTARLFVESRGEIKDVMRHLLNSAEFAASQGQKLRRPLDFLVAALRTTGTTIREPWVLQEMLEELSQVPYQWHPPNGLSRTGWGMGIYQQLARSLENVDAANP